MRKVILGIYLAGILLILAILCSACTLPCSPTKLDPTEAWATAHAHEACILATRVVAGEYIDYGVLVPMEQLPGYTQAGYRVMPISYCNPAE